MLNLDKLAFEKAMDIYNDNAITDKSKLQIETEKAIGVLAAQGLYAVYLLLNKENKVRSIIEHLKELLEKTFNKKYNDYEKALIDISNNLDNMIVAKQVMEQTFIYLRYKLKGASKNE